MIKVSDGNLEQAIAKFIEKSIPILNEARRHYYYAPKPKRKCRRGKTSAGKRTGHNRKQQGRRRY